MLRKLRKWIYFQAIKDKVTISRSNFWNMNMIFTKNLVTVVDRERKHLIFRPKVKVTVGIGKLKYCLIFVESEEFLKSMI